MADIRDRHADHDPLLIAALLDRDLTGFERTAAESRVASCRLCAALHADLVALSGATQGLPTPARPRDFSLTTADATRLAGMAPGEPGAVAPRLAGVMTDTPTTSSHASHDTMLVASLADHSLAMSERDAAEALVGACGECAGLHADLVALRDATRAMPTPSRPRHYTLTADDAARLRPAGWRRFVAAFGTSRDGFSRPLAVGLTTLGLAGLLVGTVPSLSLGSAASSSVVLSTVGAPVTAPGANPEAGTATNAGPAAAPSSGAFAAGPIASAAPAPAASGAAASVATAAPSPGDKNIYGSEQDRNSPVPVAGGDTSGSAKAASPATDQTADQASRLQSTAAGDGTGLSTLVLASGAFLIVGLGLFAIRWSARRFGND